MIKVEKDKQIFHLEGSCTKVCTISEFCAGDRAVWVTACPFNPKMEVEFLADAARRILSISPSREAVIDRIERRLDLIRERIRLQEEKKEFMVTKDISKLEGAVELKIRKYQAEREVLRSLLEYLKTKYPLVAKT